MKKFLLSVGIMACAMSVNAADSEWHISGEFNGWDHQGADYFFQTTAEDGVFTFSVPATDVFAGEFLITKVIDGAVTWDDKIGTNGDPVVVDEPYYYVPGANNFMLAKQVDNAVITLDTNEGTIEVTGTTVENVYDTLYLVGNIDGSGWDENITDYALTATDAEKTKFSGDVTITGTAYIKIKAGTVLYAGNGDNAGNVDADGNVVVDGPSATSFELVKGGSTYVVGEGEYTVTVNLPYNGDAGTVVFGVKGADALNVVEADANVAPVYYNLQGVRVENAANGLYIVVRGDKAAKEFVR